MDDLFSTTKGKGTCILIADNNSINANVRYVYAVTVNENENIMVNNKPDGR